MLAVHFLNGFFVGITYKYMYVVIHYVVYLKVDKSLIIMYLYSNPFTASLTYFFKLVVGYYGAKSSWGYL